MEYNLKKVLKNLFINLIITFVIVFIINYFGINSDKHGWFANIIDKINFIHIFGNKTANTVVIVGLAITIFELIHDVFFDDEDEDEEDSKKN
ncbi:hypothetical protein ACN9US_00345 [Staphylococcus caprae]|uniref:hypothetical protein n=1 Tax=Staphylococcus caprae TaxID=29380 RepID=UPI003B20BC14